MRKIMKKLEKGIKKIKRKSENNKRKESET